MIRMFWNVISLYTHTNVGFVKAFLWLLTLLTWLFCYHVCDDDDDHYICTTYMASCECFLIINWYCLLSKGSNLHISFRLYVLLIKPNNEGRHNICLVILPWTNGSCKVICLSRRIPSRLVSCCDRRRTIDDTMSPLISWCHTEHIPKT